MTADNPDQVLAAALIQISAHAERIARLDSRCQDIATRLSELAAEAEALAASVDDVGETLTRHTAIIDALDGLDTPDRRARPSARRTRRGRGRRPGRPFLSAGPPAAMVEDHRA